VGTKSDQFAGLGSFGEGRRSARGKSGHADDRDVTALQTFHAGLDPASCNTDGPEMVFEGLVAKAVDVSTSGFWLEQSVVD
jgi:hypothetical protein